MLTGKQALAHEYAMAAANAAAGPEDHAAKVYAGASAPMMRRRKVYAEAHDRAQQSMLYCDLRKIGYATVAEAIARRAAAG